MYGEYQTGQLPVVTAPLAQQQSGRHDSPVQPHLAPPPSLARRPPPQNKPPSGGRPRDPVWSLFEGNRQHVKCKHCPWETAHPKAFRMRAHVFACTNMPEAERKQFKALLDSLPTNEGTLNGEGQMGQDGAMEGVEREVGVEGSNANGGPKNKQVKRAKPKPAPAPVIPPKSPITCHVLDSTLGKPAADIQIRLDRLSATGFIFLAQGVTNSDGRCLTLLDPTSLEGGKIGCGIYKITFFTSEYFAVQGMPSFYPFVEIPFEIKSSDEHYHIPLLLSPFAYSTYRGS